jgi:hypothetical protein
MKLLALILLIFTHQSFAAEACNLRLGTTLGVRTLEFISGNVTHSKMALKELSIAGLKEEISSLQDMELCGPNIQKERCVLKFQQSPKGKILAMHRGSEQWLSWPLSGKTTAQKFIKILQYAGFCQ